MRHKYYTCMCAEITDAHAPGNDLYTNSLLRPYMHRNVEDREELTKSGSSVLFT